MVLFSSCGFPTYTTSRLHIAMLGFWEFEMP
jgi:hypothetical protein